MASLDVVLCNSTVTRRAIAEVYGRDAVVVPPPPALTPGGPERPVPGGPASDAPFGLCVARLLPYKNVDVVIEAARRAGVALVVVGRGPDEARLRALADAGGSGPPVTLVTDADDAQLRWLYRHAAGLVAVSHEDYGLTPLEAASFATPTLALRAGGYLDTVVEGVNGLFVDDPTVGSVAAGLERLLGTGWDPAAVAGVDRPDFAAELRRWVLGG
nr:glycosyltransferase [Rhabdothermincola salaria]